MKSIFESADVMAAYANIDLCYHQLEQLRAQVGVPQKSGLEAMIDEATGYQHQKFIDQVNTSIDLVNQIIESKKFIEADISGDEKLLKGLMTIKKSIDVQTDSK